MGCDHQCVFRDLVALGQSPQFGLGMGPQVMINARVLRRAGVDPASHDLRHHVIVRAHPDRLRRIPAFHHVMLGQQVERKQRAGGGGVDHRQRATGQVANGLDRRVFADEDHAVVGAAPVFLFGFDQHAGSQPLVSQHRDH